MPTSAIFTPPSRCQQVPEVSRCRSCLLRTPWRNVFEFGTNVLNWISSCIWTVEETAAGIKSCWVHWFIHSSHIFTSCSELLLLTHNALHIQTLKPGDRNLLGSVLQQLKLIGRGGLWCAAGSRLRVVIPSSSVVTWCLCSRYMNHGELRCSRVNTQTHVNGSYKYYKSTLTSLFPGGRMSETCVVCSVIHPKINQSAPQNPVSLLCGVSCLQCTNITVQKS